MLTWANMAALSQAGKLCSWMPSRANVTAPGGRVLFMLPEVHSSFEIAPWPSSSGERPNVTRERRSAMRSVLARYVKGQVLNLRNDMKEFGSESIDPKMRGFWEFRSQGPMAETRLFGFFALRGAFVATDFRSRDDFAEDSQEWKRTRKASQVDWDLLTGKALPMLTPWPVLTRDQFKDYTG